MTPTVSSILSQIKSLELQLAVLRMQVQKLAEQENKRPYTIADLYGRLAGKVSTSEEEIDAALYQMTPEMEEEIATVPKKTDP
jgi:hypothetical protein